MVFQKADLNFCEQLVELRLLYLTEDHGSLTEDEISRIKASLPDYYHRHLNNDLFVYACLNGDEIVSCCFLLVTEKPANPDFINGKTGTVLNVYTKPEYRRQGFAKRLLDMMLEDARNMCLDFVELRSTKDGYRLYRSVGFRDTVSKYRSMKFEL